MTTSSAAANSVDFSPEARLYIGGQLRGSSTEKTIENIDPATEEVFDVCADASAEDMDQAISASSSSAFDTSDWSTDHAFRQHCLRQLQAALQQEKEDIRAELIAD